MSPGISDNFGAHSIASRYPHARPENSQPDPAQSLLKATRPPVLPPAEPFWETHPERNRSSNLGQLVSPVQGLSPRHQEPTPPDPCSSLPPGPVLFDCEPPRG